MLGNIVGGIIGAASSLFGGKKDRDAAQEQALQNYLQQKEFAQHGIRWKVEDAKAAGLHPLYALGGSGATFTPNPIVTGEGAALSAAGQHLGRAAQAALSQDERALTLAQLKAAEASAEKDFAQAQYFRSESMRANQGLGVSKAVPVGEIDVTKPGGVAVYPLAGQDVEHPTYLPAESELAENQLFKTFYVGAGGLPIALPMSSSAGESLEPLTESPVMFLSMVNYNIKKFGNSWPDRMAQELGYPEGDAWIRSSLDQMARGFAASLPFDVKPR